MDSRKCQRGLAALALLAAALIVPCQCPAVAQEAGDDPVTITMPPRPPARPVAARQRAVKQRAVKAVVRPAVKRAVVARAKPVAAPARAAKAPSPHGPAAAAAPLQTSGSPYPLPPDTVPIPEEIFAASPATPSPPIAANGAPSPAPQTTGSITPAGLPAEMQPLVHARNAGVTQCMDALSRAASTAIDTDHEAFSTWSTSAPNAHLFQSIAMMRYTNQTAPRSASVLLVTPGVAGGCEGGTVQVVPSARSCAAIQAQLMQGGKALATLTGLPLIENLAGIRQILLPAPGNGCVMISVGLIAGAAAAK